MISVEGATGGAAGFIEAGSRSSIALASARPWVLRVAASCAAGVICPIDGKGGSDKSEACAWQTTGKPQSRRVVVVIIILFIITISDGRD